MRSLLELSNANILGGQRFFSKYTALTPRKCSIEQVVIPIVKLDGLVHESSQKFITGELLQYGNNQKERIVLYGVSF